MAPSGYSGTPLARKLGIKEGFSIYLVNQPSNYFDLFDDFPDQVEQLSAAKQETVDFIHIFVRFEKDLIQHASEVKPLLKKDGILWVSWPKGKSKLVADINRESVRDFLLSIGLVDIKVCAVDEDWSALKFMYRKKDR